MTKAPTLKPVARVDGAKRTNLKQQHERREAAKGKRRNAPAVEDTRVSDAWTREADRSAASSRLSAEERRIRKLAKLDGLKEGAKISVVKVRISNDRATRQAIRSKPGTFEWRYGRHKQDALFHAGSHLAQLWERAGIAIASSADFLRGTSSGYVGGIGDGRVAAIDKLDGFRATMGIKVAERLIDYCVIGITCAEIARKHGAKEREMASVLQQDLRDCAQHFHFLGH